MNDPEKLAAHVSTFINETGLPYRVAAAIERHIGCDDRTVGEMLHMGRDGFMSLKGVGYRSLVRLEDAMDANELEWVTTPSTFVPASNDA